MTSEPSAVPAPREPELTGQAVVVIGGSSGIGLETARRARAEGAEVILTGRSAEHLAAAAADVGARDTAAFDATDPAALDRFFGGLTGPVDHVMVTAGGSYYAPLAEIDFTEASRAMDEHLWLSLRVGQHAAAGAVRPGGSLVFITGTVARRPGVSLAIAGVVAAALPNLTANLALELAPIRVNLLATGFVDTPLSASLLGGELEQRREQLRAKLPIGRVVEPADLGALAVHLMVNTAITGSTYDIDGGGLVAGI
jgi:NAD(P)-dependent dehydrogenase (short-subunit alcohol dehydrogenase family)